MNRNLFLALIIVLSTISCKKEEKLIASEPVQEYTLPQGNHAYDQRIVDFYNKYGTYILYKFHKKDLTWNFTKDEQFVFEPADEKYVSEALDTLQSKLFRFYNDEFLQIALPYKILLASNIREYAGVDTISVETMNTYGHFAFGYTDSRILNLTQEESTGLKGSLHGSLWMHVIRTGKIPVPPLFEKATNYDFAYEFNMKNNGMFSLPHVGYATLVADFGDYIEVITTTPEQELEETVFNPENDVNGKFRLKYNAIVNYYKAEYKIDLQAIGDAQ